jgi:Cu(I)/Ag(I) efflux system membrane fusion protein
MGLLALLGGLGAGIAVERYWNNNAGRDGDTSGEDEPRILYWVAPMDANYRRDGPGKSPMGMDLIPVYEGEQPAGGEDDAGVVALSPAMVQTIGVRTATVERVELRPSIETFGTVAFDEWRTSHVHVRAEGWIEKLYVRAIGDPVREGDVLFEMFSPDLATAAWEYVRDLENPQSRLRAGSRTKLLSLGADPRQVAEITRTHTVPDRINVYAPRTGVVVKLNVADNMFMTPEMTAVSITDPSVVWLLADVFESQAALVSAGMEAEIRIAGMPERTWRGVVEYVYPDLRTETRTVQVRISIDNPDLALKPNMYASVSLLAPTGTAVLTVPDAAVIRTGRSERLILALGDGRFRARPVRIGQAAGGRVEVLDGVEEGDQVVVSSQFLIDSESSLSAAFQQMDDIEPTTAEPERAHAHGHAAPEAWAAATVNGPATDGRVNVTHEPIPALGWPSMTMDLPIAETVAAEGLRPGSRVRIGLAKGPDGLYRIVAAEALAEGS